MDDALTTLEEEIHRFLPESQRQRGDVAALRRAMEQWSQAVWKAAQTAGPYPLLPEEKTAGLRLAERPVFVCGTHRSGTTLLRDLLDGHPQLSVLPSEGSYLTGWRDRLAPLPPEEQIAFLGQEWLRRLVNPINQPPYWLLGRSGGSNTSGGSASPGEYPYISFARRLMAWQPVTNEHFRSEELLSPFLSLALAYASCHGHGAERCTRWVEKTPTNEFHRETLLTALPSAKFIQMVRDPFAVFASRKRLEVRSLGSFAGLRQTLDELARSLTIAAQNHGSPGGSHLTVRYEDLIAEPDAVMQRVAAFLEIDPAAPSLRHPTVAGIPTSSNSAFDGQRTPGAIEKPERDSRFEELTDSERKLVAAFTGESAAALGYEMPPLSARQSRLLRLRAHLSDSISPVLRKPR